MQRTHQVTIDNVGDYIMQMDMLVEAILLTP
jgi:hypothetical protein